MFYDVSLELPEPERDLGRLLTLRELRTRLIRKLRMWASQLMIFLMHVCSTSLFSSLRKGSAKVGPFLARRTCNPTDIDCALKHFELSFVNALLMLELSFKQVLIVGL